MEENSSDSDDDLEMSVITGKHDIVVRPEGRATAGFFKSSRKQYVMFPFHEEKLRHDEYGEIIQPDDYKLADIGIDGQALDDNKENALKQEDLKAEKDKTNDDGRIQLLKLKKKLIRQIFE